MAWCFGKQKDKDTKETSSKKYGGRTGEYALLRTVTAAHIPSFRPLK